MDINAWLEEATKRANIPAEDRKILEGVIAKNTGLQTYLEESGLRQSDYDRNMNKLKTEHAARLQEVADKEAAADRFATQNGEWFNQNNGKFTKATQDLEAARVKEAQLVERMKALATRYGVPEEELNIPVSAAPAVPPPQPFQPSMRSASSLAKKATGNFAQPFLFRPKWLIS